MSKKMRNVIIIVLIAYSIMDAYYNFTNITSIKMQMSSIIDIVIRYIISAIIPMMFFFHERPKNENKYIKIFVFSLLAGLLLQIVNIKISLLSFLNLFLSMSYLVVVINRYKKYLNINSNFKMLLTILLIIQFIGFSIGYMNRIDIKMTIYLITYAFHNTYIALAIWYFNTNKDKENGK